MSNYKCDDCGHCFDSPKAVREPDGFDYPPYRYSYHCPYCGNDGYSEKVETCDNCGNGIYEGETYYKLNDTGDVFCGDCIEERKG